MRGAFFVFDQVRIQKQVWICFFAAFAINLIFRLICLDTSPLWYDEIISLQSAWLDFGHIKHVSEWDNNPPFYYYCLSVWVKLLGDSEFTVRLLSVIISALTGGLLFVFCNRFFNRSTAFIASFLYLSSNLLFFYSHEARAYALSVFLALTSSYVFFSFRERASYGNMVLLGLVNFLIVYTHYITGLLLLFQLIFALACFEKRSKLRFVLTGLISLGLVLLRFTKKQFLLILDFNNPDHKFWLGKSSFAYLQETLSEILFHQLLIIPLCVLIVLGVMAVMYIRNRPISFALLYCLFSGLLSVFLLYFLGKFSSLFLDRYLLYAVPFVLISVSYPLSLIRYQWIPIGLAALFFVLSAAFYIDYATPKGMDYRGLANFIKSEKTDRDLVIVKTKDMKPMFGYYYDRNFLSEKKQELAPEEQVLFCSSWEDINQDITGFHKIYVTDSYEQFNSDEAGFVQKLSALKPFHAESRFYEGVRITVYQ